MKVRPKHIPLFFFLGGLIVFGKSLGYEFVYDDHWKIEQNLALRNLKNLPQFFSDPSTQSNQKNLSFDYYRPLTTVSYALDYGLWKNHPGGYRLENILLHGLNAALVAYLGIVLFEFSTTAACLAGFLFLVHPLQIGSVVWISERSNVLGLAFILSALLSWEMFKNKYATYLFLILGLLTKETAASIPFFIGAMDLFRNSGRIERGRVKHYLGLFSVVFIYMLVRKNLIGQVAISGYWGGTAVSNLANILRTWPLYLTSIFWPFPLKISYSDLPVVAGFMDKGVLFGTVLMMAYVAAIVLSFKKHRRISLCLALFLLAWLPGSNLIPFQALFGERLLYPMMVFAVLFFGNLLRTPSRVTTLLGALLIVTLAGASYAHLPPWKNELTLWKNAVEVSPHNWLAWANFASAQYNSSNKELDQVEENYIQALKCRPPVDQAGALFIELARINLLQGKNSKATEHAQRGLALRPDLKSQWDSIVVVSH